LSPGVDVLLVEDERVVREAAARILRLDGFKVDLAEEASTAVARLRALHPRVVLTDLMLPGFSGFDLLDRLTNDRPQVPVVLITGYATIENALHAFQHGAFDFLPKPFDVAELLGVEVRHVRRLVQERRIPYVKWGHLLRFDPVEIARWVDADDPKLIKKFADSNRDNVAEDHSGATVFLARNEWQLNRAKLDFKELRFLQTREQAPLTQASA